MIIDLDEPKMRVSGIRKRMSITITQTTKARIAETSQVLPDLSFNICRPVRMAAVRNNNEIGRIISNSFNWKSSVQDLGEGGDQVNLRASPFDLMVKSINEFPKSDANDAVPLSSVIINAPDPSGAQSIDLILPGI